MNLQKFKNWLRRLNDLKIMTQGQMFKLLIIASLVVIIFCLTLGSEWSEAAKTLEAARPSEIEIIGWCEIVNAGLPIYNDDLKIEELTVNLPNGEGVKAVILPNRNLEFRKHQAFIIRRKNQSHYSSGGYFVVPPRPDHLP